MSLPFIAFYMRDYQQDTLQLPLEGHGAYFMLLQYCWTHGRIPLDDAARAAICKVPVQRWRKQLAPLVGGYFDANGENKRATAEIARAEKLRTRQTMAGHRGAEKRWGNDSHGVAVAKPRLSGGIAVAEPRSSHGVAIKKDKLISSSGTARARVAENPTISTEDADEFAEKAREALAKSTGIGSDELVATIAAKGWVKP